MTTSRTALDLALMGQMLSRDKITQFELVSEQQSQMPFNSHVSVTASPRLLNTALTQCHHICPFTLCYSGFFAQSYIRKTRFQDLADQLDIDVALSKNVQHSKNTLPRDGFAAVLLHS
ncbi:MAG: hypothetical protein MHMPM18_001074 [Marteilia pararefringens]